jgi:YHS domain-containing protein
MPRDTTDGLRTDPAAPAARDVVCGRTLDPTAAAGQMEYGGETYFFCSEECLRRFEDQPDRFASEGTTGSGAGSRVPWPGWPHRDDES